MMACIVNASGEIALMDLDEAPPTLEIREGVLTEDGIVLTDANSSLRVLERLTGNCDPISGIVIYEEVRR